MSLLVVLSWAAQVSAPVVEHQDLAPRTIAVAPFDAKGTAEAWLAEGLSHALSGHFYDERNNVVTVRQVSAAMRGRGFTDLDGERARIIAREVGADTLVVGAVRGGGKGELALTIQVV